MIMFQFCHGKERHKIGAMDQTGVSFMSNSDDEQEGNNNNTTNATTTTTKSMSPRTLWQQQQQQQQQIVFPRNPNAVPILLEIVSALGMECIRGCDEDNKNNSIRNLANNVIPYSKDVDVDPYCIVKVGRGGGTSNPNNNNNNNNKSKKRAAGKEKEENDDERQVHKTKIIKDDSSPIWTIKTDSLCLLELEQSTTTTNQYIKVELWCVWKMKHILAGSLILHQDTLSSGTGKRCSHILTYQQPQPQPSEHLLGTPQSDKKQTITLNLRYRRATYHDYMFLHDIPDPSILKRHSTNHSNSFSDHADDLDFKHISRTSLLARRSKTISLTTELNGTTATTTNNNQEQKQEQQQQLVNGKGTTTRSLADGTTTNNTANTTCSSNNSNNNSTSSSSGGGSSSKKQNIVAAAATTTTTTSVQVFRVWPGPDPDREKETLFLSKQQLQLESEKPSKQWVEAGSGDYATVYLEILSCDDLPNMDTELVTGKTDAFCGIVFEDVFVRSSVVYDSLNPRFMPWSTRAFMFHQAHPSSILLLGVFDYDEGPLKVDDPIGRISLHLENFETDTMYTLTYPLYHGDTQAEDHRGKVTLRLRIERHRKRRAYGPAPRFIINTKSDESWRTLRYITRGSVDMTEATVQSVRLYAQELLSYWKKYCYLFDVLFGILLWRGRTKIHCFRRTFSIWFPIDSVVLFTAVVVGLEFPKFLPSVLFYVLAYCLLAVNYHSSHHPSPWRRVRSFFLGGIQNKGLIERGTGADETELLERLDMYKANRVTCFLYQFMYTGLNVYRVYSKSTPMDISTVTSSASIFSKLYANYLSYGHLLLRMWCRYIRLLRNFVNWKTPSTGKVTSTLLWTATIWALFPYKDEAFLSFRIWTYICLGPWVKLLDVFWIHKYYRTTEELLRDGIPETMEEMHEEIMSRPNILKPILEYKGVEKMVHSGRLVQENTIKLRDIRERRYGKWSELVPPVDTSRFPSVPFEDASFAQPYAPSAESAKEGDYVDLPPETLKWTYIPGQKLDDDMIPRPSIQPTRLDVPTSATAQEKKVQ